MMKIQTGNPWIALMPIALGYLRSINIVHHYISLSPTLA